MTPLLFLQNSSAFLVSQRTYVLNISAKEEAGISRGSSASKLANLFKKFPLSFKFTHLDSF